MCKKHYYLWLENPKLYNMCRSQTFGIFFGSLSSSQILGLKEHIELEVQLLLKWNILNQIHKHQTAFIKKI